MEIPIDIIGFNLLAIGLASNTPRIGASTQAIGVHRPKVQRSSARVACLPRNCASAVILSDPAKWARCPKDLPSLILSSRNDLAVGKDPFHI